jgi:NAD+ synthase (glutamine-hydrolysing)
MKIAIAQMQGGPGDFEATGRRMIDFAQRAADAGADLVCYPLCCLTGTGPVSTGDSEGYLFDLCREVLSLASKMPVSALVPVTIDVDGTPVSEFLLLEDGQIRPLRMTSYLESAASGEKSKARGALPEVEVCGLRLGLAMTYEELDDYVEYDYHVDAVLFASSYGFAVDDASSALGCAITESRFVADADAMGAWVIAVGSVGCYDLQVFSGSSFVLAPWGELAAQAPSFEEALLVADVEPGAEGPLAEPLTPEVYDPSLITWGALCQGLSQMVEQSGHKGVALVVDGSLASVTLAALATDALGPTRVHVCVITGQSKAADSCAWEIVDNLRLKYLEFSLERMGGAGNDAAFVHDLALANMCALARTGDLLPLSCVDKTALALEDVSYVEAGLVMPFGDIYRSDVIDLYHLRNTISPVIPRGSKNRFSVPKIAGLKACGPSNEVRVEFADLVLCGYVEWERGLTELCEAKDHPEVRAAIVNEARRRISGLACRPVCPVVSSKTLREARASMGDVWTDHVRGASERLTAEAMGKLVEQFLGVSEAEDGELREGEDAQVTADTEREARELLSYLRDFSQGGVMSGMGDAGAAGLAGMGGLGGTSGPQGSGGRHGSDGAGPGFFYDGPFSQN